MRRKLKQLVVILCLVFIFLFIIFLINQTVQLVNLCDSIHPLFGEIVKYVLIGLHALLIIFSFYYLVRLPKPLKWPEQDNPTEYKEFLLKIRERLIKNKNLPSSVVEKHLGSGSKDIEPNVQALEQGIREAEKELDKLANKEIKTTAQTVFVSTAISQSGSLDGIVVLMGQTRMVWRIAGIYNQRPALREMIKLYANVAGTSLAARAIEDVDAAEILEPMISSFSGVAVINIVPLISILTNSIFSGTANALLTLRTGIITRKYCGLFSYFESKRKYEKEGEIQLRKFIRVSAIREAGKLLGEVILEPSKQVFSALLGTLKKVKDIPGKVVEEVGKASKDIITRIGDLFRKKSSGDENGAAA
jgi:uncharacterized membrane protein YcjF (UPF0283 family)